MAKSKQLITLINYICLRSKELVEQGIVQDISSMTTARSYCNSKAISLTILTAIFTFFFLFMSKTQPILD